MTVAQILYSGLGGHSSVGFSLVEADVDKVYNHIIIFYGIEDMPPASVEKCRALGIGFFFVKKTPGLDINSQWHIIRILKKTRPDVVLLHSVNLIVPVFLNNITLRTRIIAVEHQPNHLKTKKDWIWSVLIMLLAKKIVYLTDVYKEQMKQKLRPIFKSSKVAIINNGININLFKPSNNKLSNQEDLVKIGMLARLTTTKDHDTLIKSFRILSDKITSRKIELFLAGDGETKESLQQLTLKLEIREKVHFVGLITESESVQFLNDLDIYVHASLGETMSTSIMQAMACGKPIIASSVQGITNMVQDGQTGLLVPPLDPASLTIKLEMLIEDAVLQNSLGINALQYARLNFTNTKMLNAYISLFHD